MESSCIAHRYTKSTPTSSSLLSSTVIFHMHWCFGHPPPSHPATQNYECWAKWFPANLMSKLQPLLFDATYLWICSLGNQFLKIYSLKSYIVSKEKKRTIWNTVKIKLMTKRGSTISSTLTIEARGWNSLLMIFLLFSLQACFMIKDFKANFLGKLI